jgi:ferredoxin
MSGEAQAPRVWLEIDGQRVPARPGQTVMQAADAAGIRIPRLCAAGVRETWTSCMVCLVRDRGSGKLVPSCSARVEPGMRVDSDTPEVLRARRSSLDLLLAEHRADCRAPCARACPARPDIPALMRALRRGDEPGAMLVLAEAIALPGVASRVCPAPCERSCLRRRVDESLSIRGLEEFCAVEGARGRAALPAAAAATGREGLVAVVGAGPAGLSAAFHLLRRGHQVAILDERDRPGGALVDSVPEAVLPRAVLERDVDALRALGARFELGRRVEESEVRGLLGSYRAVVLATGAGGAVEPGEGIFPCGSVVRSTHLAARGMGDGLDAARAVDAYLTHGSRPEEAAAEFDSHAGRSTFPGEPAPRPRAIPPGATASGSQAHAEALRCLQCDCAKAASCDLRTLASAVRAQQGRPRGAQGTGIRREVGSAVVHEPAKCILCGRCVATSRALAETWGMAFHGRGLDTTVGPAGGRSIDEALTVSAVVCARGCPTGALSLRGAQPGRHPSATGEG